MRTSLLRERLAAAGARFRDRYGVEVVAGFADQRTEYSAVRDAVGVTDFSFLRAFRVPEDKGLDFLDALLAGNVPKIRFGRVLHTMMLDAGGLLAADCYVANNDQEFILLCESILPDAQLDACLQAQGIAEAGVEDLTASQVAISVDGFKAWAPVKQLFGADVLGLPYLSIENYTFEGAPVRLFRAGKTSEFGYLLLAPVAVAGALFDALKVGAEAHGGRLCGVDIHDDLRLEGRFPNIHREGLRVRDPLTLGLQWMADFDKESFLGSEALQQRRKAGLQRKIVGVATETGADLHEGAAIYCAGRAVGEVVTACESHVLGKSVGLAVLPVEWAYSGLVFQLGAADGPLVRTISMPPIMPKSLGVKLDEM